REALGLDPGALVLLLVGALRPYKQVPELAREFGAADLDRAQLLIAGRPASPELASEVEAAARDAEGVVLALGWLDDVQLARCFAAADVVVCPYAELHN